MSVEKNVSEAKRWMAAAKDDLDSAIILKREKKFAHSCFHSQQAAEKAVKSVWYFIDADPWGHSIKKLIDDLAPVNPSFFQSLEPLNKIGLTLDRFYIPTRYPNGLPDITPDVAFTEEDADSAVESAEKIVETARSLLKL